MNESDIEWVEHDGTYEGERLTYEADVPLVVLLNKTRLLGSLLILVQ
jgi:hypothetical protein